MSFLKSEIKNLDSLKRSINLSSLLIFVIIFVFSLCVSFFVHSSYMKSRGLVNQDNIQLAINGYKSNLSEKLAIIASSTVFLDFLRSGAVTRQRILPEFTTLFYSLRVPAVSGMKISANDGESIFSYGKATPSSLTLHICYLNHSLNPVVGDCDFLWTLYFHKSVLLADISASNNSISLCHDCKSYPFNDSKMLGSFLMGNTSQLDLPLRIDDKTDTLFYSYFILMTVSLIFLAMWGWTRLSSLLNNYISAPVMKLTNSLKLDSGLDRSNNLDEIQFLINEIDTWREKLKKAKALEHNAHLGKIAAQLAHDIRSPLAVIGMVLNKVSNIPESYLKLMLASTERISAIANSFLVQYRDKDSHIKSLSIQPEPIVSIVEKIFNEKLVQFSNTLATLNLEISPDKNILICRINAVEFERAISNLINNAVEALTAPGFVKIRVFTDGGFIVLTIEDSGMGIPAQLLEKIIEEGVSIGKENGSGLGLSHAKQMIESWGGSLDVFSVVAKGTLITLRLPMIV